jgi:hypothetical protein
MRAGLLVPLLLMGLGCQAGSASRTWHASALVGVRSQPSGWENSSAPTLRVDGSWRPGSLPVGVAVSADLTGYTLDQEGEQTASVGVGLARWLALHEDSVWAYFSAGRQFLDSTTDRDAPSGGGYQFVTSSDSWQAWYADAGLQVELSEDGGWALGVLVRFSAGDGPSFESYDADGELVDVYLVLMGIF